MGDLQGIQDTAPLHPVGMPTRPSVEPGIFFFELLLEGTSADVSAKGDVETGAVACQPD